MQNTAGPPAAASRQGPFGRFFAVLSEHRSLAASLALFNGWVFAMSWSGALNAPLEPFAAGLAANGFWLTSLIVCTLVLGAFFLVPRLRRGVRPLGLTAGACCMAASVALIGVADFFPGSEPYLRVCGGIASGLGTGVMTAYWGQLITRCDSGAVLQFVAFSLLASAVLTVLVSLAPKPVGLACMIAIPFVAAQAFRRAMRFQDGEAPEASDARPPRQAGSFAGFAAPAAPAASFASVAPASGERRGRVSPLALFMGLVVVLGTSAGLLRSLMSADVQAAQSAWVFGIATVCAALMLLLSKAPGSGESFALFYRAIGFIAAAFVVMALAVRPAAGQASAALAIHTMGFMYFYGLLWVFCVVFTRRCPDAARVFIGGFLANQTGQIVGALVGGWFRTVLDPQSIVSSASNAMVYLLLFATIVLMARLSSTSKPREAMIGEEPMERACALASQRFGLTPRESEILVYLVKGCDRGLIAHSLSVSTETVKSHTRHIYEKLGAHSRLELFNAVARCLEDAAL